MYLNSLNYFRAIAIIFIVAGHCLGIADFAFNTIAGKTVYNLITGGTTLFVFISGFLFHHVFSKRYDFKKFYVKKIKYILLPYVLLALVPILLSVFGKHYSGADLTNYYAPRSGAWYDLYLIPILKHYATGSMFIAYWYIPFVMIVFAFAPLHMRFIQLKTKTQVLLVFVLLIIAMLMHRPLLYTNTIAVFQAVLYFTPVYLLGIICSLKKERIYDKFKSKEIYFLTTVIGLAILQVIVGEDGTYMKLPLEYNGIDIMIFQKLLLSLFFMIWLHRFETKKITVLALIASSSFGIFFIHCLLIIAFIKIKSYFGFSFPPNNPLIYIAAITCITLISFLIVKVIQKIAPKHSRYIIGS